MSEQDDKKYPCATLDEALGELRRPPAPQAVKFKIQNAVGEYAQVVPYVDARLVYDRLDHVCGGNWTAVFEEVPSGLRPQRPVEPQDKLRRGLVAADRRPEPRGRADDRIRGRGQGLVPLLLPGCWDQSD